MGNCSGYIFAHLDVFNQMRDVFLISGSKKAMMQFQVI